MRGIHEAPQAGDPELLVKREDVLGPSGMEVQFVSHPAKKLLRLLQSRSVAGRELARADEVRIARGAVAGKPHPLQKMEVAQATSALLDVWLQEKISGSESFILLPSLLELLRQELLHGLAGQLFPEGRGKGRKEVPLPGEPTGFHQRCSYDEICFAHRQAIIDGS